MYTKYWAILLFGLSLNFLCTAMENQVDCTNRLDVYEHEYYEKRSAVTRTAIESITRLPRWSGLKVPRINMSLSGGGVRAEAAAVAFLAGCEDIQLLQATTSVAALSGSTWAIIPWMLHRTSPVIYSQILKRQLQENFWDLRDAEKTEAVLGKMKTRIVEQVPALKKYKLNVTEVWGHLVARRLLHDLEKSLERVLTFEDIRTILDETNAYPFPIFTALIAETDPNYEGLEVTPFSVYSSYLDAAVKTQHFGCKFVNGEMTTQLPEKPLSLFLGIFGSAYTISPADAILSLFQELFDKMNFDEAFLTKIKPKMTKCLEKVAAYNLRNFDIKVPNFVYGLQYHNMQHAQSFHLLDYGINVNIPIFPFARHERKSDILVICDASSDAVDCDYTELKKAQIFAESRQMPFPTLKKFKSISKNLKIFYEEDPLVPVVIYVANTTAIPTTQMNYSEDMFESVFNPMYKTITDDTSVHAITETIKFKTSQLNGNAIPNHFRSLPEGKYKAEFCNIL